MKDKGISVCIERVVAAVVIVVTVAVVVAVALVLGSVFVYSPVL